jgi:hypothetical protein
MSEKFLHPMVLRAHRESDGDGPHSVSDDPQGIKRSPIRRQRSIGQSRSFVGKWERISGNSLRRRDLELSKLGVDA